MRWSPRHRQRAFTLIELLVVIGIIAVLVGILVPTLGKARQQAKRVKASSDLHELVSGYLQYTLANRGRLLYGYTPDTVNGVPVLAELKDGTVLSGQPALRYPWRLVRYVGNMMPILWAHHDMPRPAIPFDPNDTRTYYEPSIRPGFGLNSIFLGGHAGPKFGGFVDANGAAGGDRPNYGKHVAFVTSEIHHPSTQIVFTEARVAPQRLSSIAATDAEDDGYFYVLPPRANSGQPDTIRLWQPSADGLTAMPQTSLTGGFPNTRYGTKGGTLVGFFDAHVASMTAREMDDMRFWSPKADRADWTFNFK